jgi:hypothetical protein
MLNARIQLVDCSEAFDENFSGWVFLRHGLDMQNHASLKWMCLTSANKFNTGPKIGLKLIFS